jgi:predicted secreted Zn-dependent protease
MRAVVLAWALAVPGMAVAKDSSKIVAYPVLGATAEEVYAFIKRHAPRAAPNATFAFTLIATKTEKREADEGASCRYNRFSTSAVYAFYLPRHAKPETLPPPAREMWAAFARYLRGHEEGHRAIWRSCLAEYDAKSLQLSGADCKGLDAAREKLFTRIKRTCVRQDEAYDASFRKDVVKQPFVKEALGR